MITIHSSLRIALIQHDFLVGNIHHNFQIMLQLINEELTKPVQPHIIVFPELALTGYMPEDLLLRASFLECCEKTIEKLVQTLADTNLYVVLGAPGVVNGNLQNQAIVFYQGKIIVRYAKRCLPNHGVFDEKRYFIEGRQAHVFDCFGVKVGLLICEDLWNSQIVSELCALKPQLVLSINASPFQINKLTRRITLIQTYTKQYNCAFCYLNLLGGQDELVFDGNSFALDSSGQLICLDQPFSAQNLLLEFDVKNNQLVGDLGTKLFNSNQYLTSTIHEDSLQKLYEVLKIGLRDYVFKNNFQGVLLGLSGGIDSALTLVIAVDALGKDRVRAVMVPYRYTSQMSLDDAQLLATRTGVHYDILPIHQPVEDFNKLLSASFINTSEDITEENLQSRTRAVILMALSNKKRLLLLTTGNKSEIATGYATLYGDMAGGFNVIKDLYKTTVFELARWRNQLNDIIPDRIITRPPSAELRENQIDQNTLPDYAVLDVILKLYIEEQLPIQAIANQTHYSKLMINQIVTMLHSNEFKRRQSAIGIKLSERAFGRDWRYPITSGWQECE